MKILIIGSKGQLGYDCEKILAPSYEVLGVDIDKLDITNKDDTDKFIKNFSPNVIINCAAFTQVDLCETKRDIAFNVNVKGPENLAESICTANCKLIHISTDYVFDGTKPLYDPYFEDDETNPISYYGKTKLQGEKAIESNIDNYAILRTSWLYGINGSNFVKTILKLASKKPMQKLKIINDQFGSPTWSETLCYQIFKIIENDSCGIFHATSEGYCSWYQFAKHFLKKFELENTILPCTTEQYPTPAARPKNSILENKNLKQKKINIFCHWKSDIDQFINKFKDKL